MLTWCRKASIAAITAAASTFFTANADGVMTSTEWVGVAVAGLTAGIAVYWLPNSNNGNRPKENDGVA